MPGRNQKSLWEQIYICVQGQLPPLREKRGDLDAGQKYLQKMGTGFDGNLVTIPDKDTLKFILNTLSKTLQWPDELLWIGLYVHDSKWKWATGIITMIICIMSFNHAHVILNY